MRNYNDEDLLEMVEMYAEEMGYISSAEELSERFDQMIEECMSCEFKRQLENDDCLVSETFNNWSDGLCKDGEIHSVQYENYEYNGEWV